MCSDSLTHLSIFQKPATITPPHHKRLMYAHLTYLISCWFPPFDLITVHTHYMYVPFRNTHHCWPSYRRIDARSSLSVFKLTLGPIWSWLKETKGLVYFIGEHTSPQFTFYESSRNSKLCSIAFLSINF